MQKKNTNNEKNVVEFISAEFGAGLPAPASGYISGNIPCGPHLALGSLFKATSDPQSVAVCFRFGYSLIFCPASFPSALGQGVVQLVT